MELHSLQHADGAKKKAKRVARGHASGHGKTATRGHKGQKSRSGYSRKPAFEGGQMPLNRRLPKRGFNHQQRHPLAELNLDVLASKFEDGAVITTDSLRELGIVKVLAGGVKLLGRGDVDGKKFTVRVEAVSAGAKDKIEKAGGAVELVGAPEAAAEAVAE
jgi:large subunit ribosomal protein L15